MASRGRSRTDTRIRELDERFDLFVDNVRDYAIFMTDSSGTVVSWNAGVERLLGYSEREFIGKALTDIYIPEDVSSGAAAREIALAKEKGRSEDERWHLRKDGSRFWASGVLTALFDEGGRLRGFAKVMRDITERKLAEEERKQLLRREQQARQEAEAAARVRDEFLATVSHELRTPLNAILGWARILEDQALEPERIRHALETISRNAVLQSKLIDDLLDVSRILAGRTTVWNLLSNAIKFTPDGGRVVVEILREETNATLSVKDTGVGIRPEFLPRVFDPFSQADSTTERGHGGLGLGLAIVRHLVEQHGGTVHAESGGEGQGATFTVKLPLSSVRTEPAPGGSLETDIKPSLNTVSVLIVEDHGDSREAAVVALELAGASVKTATSVREALEIIADTPPNVVLCDIGLPQEDGFGFIKKLRSLPRDEGGTIPAAALTAYTRPEDRLRALQAGFQIHLAKPIEPSELVAAIATLAGTTTPRRM